MIVQADIDDIDREYFEILAWNLYCITIRSYSTGHYWHLLEQIANGHQTFRISHKHNKKDPYHLQTNRPSVASCCEYIRSHDAYHLERTRRKEERQMHRQKNPFHG